MVKYICGKDVFVYISKFGEDDEYSRVMVSPFEIEPNFKIALLKLDYNKKFITPNHRMILGALMSYGIKRDTIGDIYITTDNEVYICATNEIKDYLIEEFRVLSHHSVSLYEVDEIEGEIKHNYDIMQTFVASLRLDLIVAERFKLSRKNAQEIIKRGDCKVNQRPIDNTSHVLKEGDLISLKGFGRMKLLEVGGMSKSNNIHVRLAKLL